eukprot:32982_1
MADMYVFKNVDMCDEYMKLLEINANTFWDYLSNAQFGILFDMFQHKEYQAIYDVIKSLTMQSEIYYLDLNGFSVRFPVTGLLCIIGFIVGIRGYLTFVKYSTTLCISFLFYAAMCSTAGLLHSLVPFSYVQFRWWLTYLDMVCTGISGLFLTISLYSIVSFEPKRPNTRDKYVVLLLIILFLFVLFHFPWLQDHVVGLGYISVLVSSSYIVCVSSIWKQVDRDLWKIGMFGPAVFAMIVISAAMSPILCPLTNGKFNVGIISMGWCDVGFMIVLHFASKFYTKKYKRQ